jgi:hypothetical protein
MTGAEDRLYCGCHYDQALLQAYLVRRGLLGPVSSWKRSNISKSMLILKLHAGVPNTLSKEHCHMILLLLKDQFVSILSRYFGISDSN